MKPLLTTGLYGLALLPALALASPGTEAIEQHCTACHQAQEGGQGWGRISQQRKTPEGWDMTVARMQLMHGLELPADTRHTIVKHLADTQDSPPRRAPPSVC